VSALGLAHQLLLDALVVEHDVIILFIQNGALPRTTYFLLHDWEIILDRLDDGLWCGDGHSPSRRNQLNKVAIDLLELAHLLFIFCSLHFSAIMRLGRCECLNIRI